MFKEHAQNLIITSMEEVNANVAISMIYGDTTNLDEGIQDDFETIGVSHLMSVSGTHITSFMLIINTILGLNTKVKVINKNKKIKSKTKIKTKTIRLVLQIISIWMYIIFTGFSISVVRAGIMLIISIVCNALNKRKDKHKVLAVTFLIMLFQNPFSLFNTGMRLSFLATLGIIMCGNHIVKLFEKATGKTKNEVIKRITEYIAQNIAITIAVQLLIIPIQIQAFNKLPFPIVIPNLILGLISIPIRVLGTIGIMLSFVPMLSCKIFSMLEIFVKFLINVVRILKTVSFGISTVSQPVIFFVLYYILIFIIYIFLKLNSITNKYERINLKKLLKCLKIIGIILTILLITMAITVNIYSIYCSEYVYFFNVEQGDMSYIKSGPSSIIVDIGSLRNKLAYNTISSYFKTSNLKKVDAIIISHMHKDHINGLEDFVKKYNVGIIIYAKPKDESPAYQNFKEMLISHNINSKEVKAGEIINVGKIKVQVLLPDENYIVAPDEINANSLVCIITVGDKKMLYMGDASVETEEKLIKQNIDMKNVFILKVGHHGSKTSTSHKFIQVVQPKHAIISALKKYYGHPHENTIETLKQNNVYTYLTENIGAIKFKLN